MPVLSRRRSLVLVSFCVALAMNLINLFEPLTVDDVCHQYYAQQVAEDPLHPFEFELVWHQRPEPAWDVMVAPVNSYYWAPAIVLFGDSPVAWHMWYLPVQWLFCLALLALCRRFAYRYATPLMASIALGPSVLPGVNLMLEVPMLSLSLSGLALVMRAYDRSSWRLAVGAGLLLGLSMQTKYSALGLCAPWVLAGLVRWRPREILISLGTAATVFLGIEFLLGLSHGGGSYFLRQLELTQVRVWSHLIKGMFLQVGGLGAPAALLALYAMRTSRYVIGAVTLVYAAAFYVVAVVPNADARSLADLAYDSLAYLVLSLVTWSVAAVLFVRIAWQPAQRLWRVGRVTAAGRWGLFFGLWFLTSIAGSFVVSPFPAARRSMMVSITMTLAAGWLAGRTRPRGLGLVLISGLSVLLGFGYEAVDYLEGRAIVSAAHEASEYTKATDATAKVYFTGGWGFEFYAPRAGMQPLLRGRSQLEKGDFVVVGSIDGSEVPWFEPSDRLEFVHEISTGNDGVPFSLLFNYYSGLRPLDSQSGPRFYATVYRAKQAFHVQELTPRTDSYHASQR